MNEKERSLLMTFFCKTRKEFLVLTYKNKTFACLWSKSSNQSRWIDLKCRQAIANCVRRMFGIFIKITYFC